MGYGKNLHVSLAQRNLSVEQFLVSSFGWILQFENRVNYPESSIADLWLGDFTGFVHANINIYLTKLIE